MGIAGCVLVVIEIEYNEFSSKILQIKNKLKKSLFTSYKRIFGTE